MSSLSSSARAGPLLLVLGLALLASLLWSVDWRDSESLNRATLLLVVGLPAGLTFVLAASMFSSTAWGVLAAGFLISMPMVWRATRASDDGLLMLPFVAAWLLACDRFKASSDHTWLWAAGGALGLGLYSHPAALVMMPAYLALTIAALGASPRMTRRVFDPALAFCVVAAPIGVYLVTHPDYFRSHVIANGLYDAQRFGPLQGLREMTSWVGLTARSEVYWDYFNPAFLFLSGRTIGGSFLRPQVLLLPFAILLPLGLSRIARESSAIDRWLLLGGFIASPLASALTARPPNPNGFLIAAPFAAIIGTHGAVQLISSRRGALRLLGVTLVVASLVTVAVLARS